MTTAQYFTERKARADLEAFDRILDRQGGEPPQPGDELPGRHHRDSACDRRGKQDVVMDLHFC